MRNKPKKIKKENPFKELMAHFNFIALTLLTKSLTFAVRFFLFNNQIEYDLNDNVMKMVNRAKIYYKRVPIDSIIDEHDFILLSNYEGVYRSIGYYDVYQVYEEVSKSITRIESGVGSREFRCIKEHRKDRDFEEYKEKINYNQY